MELPSLTDREKMLCAVLVVTNACWLGAFAIKCLWRKERKERVPPEYSTIGRGLPRPDISYTESVQQGSGIEETETIRRRNVPLLGSTQQESEGSDAGYRGKQDFLERLDKRGQYYDAELDDSFDAFKKRNQKPEGEIVPEHAIQTGGGGNPQYAAELMKEKGVQKEAAAVQGEKGNQEYAKELEKEHVSEDLENFLNLLDAKTGQ